MKRHVLLILIPLVAISSLGCRKWLERPEEKIEGDWSLDDVSRSEFVGWDNVTSPYTGGIFHFDEDGTARFTSASDTLNGQWSMHRGRSGYYNEEGDWVTDYHLMMQIFLADFQTNQIFNIYFDNFAFRRYNRIVATYYSASYRVRYRFDRR